MNKEDLEVIAFQIILHSGDARTLIHKSIELMKKGEFEEAEKQLEEANSKLVEAHKAQTELIENYVNGEKVVIEIIMVHAQDHLMTAMTFKEMAIEFLEMYKQLYELKKGEVVNA